ncbi:MAG TPA: glycosyltransferase family 4 protein [Levilinea sp.]|nr:glycosyltransferase family 4 protein [Levilinea sp.]
MPKVLSVATAGLRAGQLDDIHNCCFPRVDYLEIQRLISADTLDYSQYRDKFSGGFFRYLETQLRSDVYLSTLSWMRSRQYPLVFTWSERAGIPFAFYKKIIHLNGRFITMFTCWSHRQETVITKLGLFAVMDEIIVHCTSMKRKLTALGAAADSVHIIPYSIDQAFFIPQTNTKPEKNVIFSVGEPRTRDYPALIKAVGGLSCHLKIAASGHWYAREKNHRIKSSFPDNVTIIRHLPQVELRRMYESAQFVVLPVHNLVYSAGATSTLEASAMARAVIAFRSEGITDYIVDGETGILIDPGDFRAMRDAIEYLLANPHEARRMGENARQQIEEKLSLETYVAKIADLLKRNIPISTEV